jgi:hypothetical protein
LRTEIGDRTHLVEIHAALVHAALARKEMPAAIEHGNSVRSLLDSDARASLRQQAHYALFALAAAQDEPENAVRHLARALAASDEMAAALPETDRARFLRNVPLNRNLASAAKRYEQREDVTIGMGKQAKTVTWTLRLAQDYLTDDETERRRHVLARLLREAETSDASPTHDQLAAILGVSRRTILRDLAAMHLSPSNDGTLS